MLEQEREYYNENLSAWLMQYSNKFLLIKGSELIGAFDTYEGTLAEGARQFGLDSYLIRRVGEQEQQIKIPALTLGLLHDPFEHPKQGAS